MSGYFDDYLQNLQTMQNLQAAQNTQAMYNTNWTTTLVELQNQKSYLEDLLCKTAIKLNALRERHMRNERALNDDPRPRLKKRKIQQNQWRTDKTIKTCEKEERVILDCLRVCETNINTLVSILYPAEASSVAAGYSLSESWASHHDTESSATDIEWNGWNGWVGAEAVSPFQRETRRPVSVTSIPPEVSVEGVCPSNTNISDGKPPPLPPRICLQPALDVEPAVPPPPPNTARSTQSHLTLSPAAETFRPDSSGDDVEVEACSEVIDKLSISSLLASKHVQKLRAAQKRRFADAALSHLFTRLSEHKGTWRSRLGPHRSISYEEGGLKPKVECVKATDLLLRSTSI